jgi:hypothetical protein
MEESKMKNTVKKTFATILAIVAFFATSPIITTAEAAFTTTDLVGRSAITSFKALLDALPERPALGDDDMWVLSAPDGSAIFAWRAKESEARVRDVYIQFDARPFIDAGLDVSKLPKGVIEGDKIVIGTKLSNGPLVYEGDITPLSSFEQIVKLDRDSIGYHAALDHYGVTLSDGTLFEWAKDVFRNDKDVVFAVNPQTFIDAGVDPSRVEGWVFAKVPVEDAKGRKIDADKFLKPFNLK